MGLEMFETKQFSSILGETVKLEIPISSLWLRGWSFDGSTCLVTSDSCLPSLMVDKWWLKLPLELAKIYFGGVVSFYLLGGLVWGRASFSAKGTKYLLLVGDSLVGWLDDDYLIGYCTRWFIYFYFELPWSILAYCSLVRFGFLWMSDKFDFCMDLAS